MDKIEKDYCEYCKNNEASIHKLEEYNDKTCPVQIKTFIDVFSIY
jgi:hypothetical protein